MRRLLPLLLLLVPVISCAGTVTDEAWPRVTILPTAADSLASYEPEAAVTLTGFTRLRESAVIGNQPVASAAWSPQGLFVSARVPLPPGQKAHARATDFDGTVWEDDCIEIHLDRGHAHKQNYQFIVNALGTKFDALGGDAKFNAEWQATAVNEAGEWSCTVFIPWAAVGKAPAAGEVDGFNLVVNSSYLGGTLTLAPLQGSAHDTPSYLHLVYGQNSGLSMGNLDANKLQDLSLKALGGVPVSVEYQLRRGEQELERKSVTVAAGATETVAVRAPLSQGLPEPGQYTGRIVARTAEGLVLSRTVGFAVTVPLQVTASAFIGEGRLDLKLQPQPGLFPPADTTMDVQVEGPNGVVLTQAAEPAAAGPTVVTLTRAQVPAGKLRVAVTARNKRTGLEYKAERTYDSPLQPEWKDTKEGLSDKVPAPWTAVSAAGKVVKCWGRLYDFAKGLFPAAVTTRDKQVLQAPITLTGTVNGKALSWKPEAGQVQAKAVAATVTGGASSAGLKLSGKTTVEYDGMVRVDVTLTPAQAETTVQNLALEIPLKPEHARYLYHFPGRWGSVDNSAYLPKECWSNSFRPYIWLGDEDRGFSWFCESDRNWFPLDNKTALVIERTPTATVLRCNLIAGELKLTGPLTYTFAFQATPVKPVEKTVWDYRITHHGNYGLEKEKAVTGGKIAYPAAGHIRKEQGTFECWYRPAVDSENTVPFEQRQYQGNRDLFTVHWSPGMNGSNAGLYYNGTVQGLVGWSRTDGVVTDNPQAPCAWKAGEWHHVAMTWDPKFLRIYLDGKMLSETANNNFLGAPLEEAEIWIGGDTTLATIDEVRILSVARAPVVPEKAFEVDGETLLLDHFEGYGRAGETPAPRVGGEAKAAGGTPALHGKGEAGGTPAPRDGGGTADPWLKFAPGKWGQAPTWEPALGRLRIEEMAEQGVRTICFHEHWVPYQSYPHVTEADRPKLRSLVDGLHASKLNLLLYMSRQFADNAPEWELYNEDACTEPRPAPYTRYPVQRDYLACWNGPYRDFALHWLGKTMDEFGNDGWYLDGPEWPMPCANRHHGCGYETADGKVRPTYDIFATREFMQRLYVLTRQRKSEGQLNIHNSTVMVTPTLGFGTSTWGGEQIDAIKPPARTLDFMPLDSFRTEFMGRQWGIPAEFLVYDGMPYYAKDVLAYTLLHGVLIRPGAPDSMERTAALWKVHDEFPFSHGEMLGYWMNGDYVKVAGSPSGSLAAGPEAVYATAWRLPKKGALLVVSNLTDKDSKAELSLNLAKLGTGKGRVWDALSGEALAVEKGKVTVEVASWRYRVLRVE